MPDALTDELTALRKQWTDQYVLVEAGTPEGGRFAGRIGRVITVNAGGKAIVDFADGAWYDLPPDVLKCVSREEAQGRHDATANSAQTQPARQA